MKHKHHDWLKELFYFNLDLLETAFFLLYDLSELLLDIVATVPSVTVSVTPASVDISQTITISGVVNSDTDVPAPSAAVSIAITDSAGNAHPAITATTDATGAYTATFIVTAGFAPGIATVEVTALGTTGTATFTNNNSK